jgi:hypothetical protein
MTSGINHQIRLAGRPVGFPWQFTEAPIPEPRDGEVLTRVRRLREPKLQARSLREYRGSN